MKVQVVCFSPSGNTLKVALQIQQQLRNLNAQCEIANLTGDQMGLRNGAWQRALASQVKPHDILVIGGPVYAHHLHYNVLDIIRSLPACDDIWGRLAIPFITYGGISSGVALKEAGSALQKSGRTVVAGLKAVASHRMTRAFMDFEYNSDLPFEPTELAVQQLVERILSINELQDSASVIRSFAYNGIVTTLKARLIFQEKVWHQKRYPQISINQSVCTACGKCAKTCPVLHIRKDEDGKMVADQGACIHCLNCVATCPKKAIQLTGDLHRGQMFMSKMIRRFGNTETPATAVYPLMKK